MSLFPGEPSGPPPSKINGGLKSGRSVSSNPDNSMSAKAKSARNNTTMADIDKLLEEDAVVLMNMKRDLEKAQQNEIRKSFIHLQEIQKQHDTIHRENNLREKQLLNATNVLNGLKTFIDGGKKVTEEDECKISEMTTLLEEFHGDLDAEQKTTKIMDKIWNTLKTEIMKLQVETRKCTDKLEASRHDYRIAASVLQGSSQEYQKKVKQLDDLKNTIKSREHTRVAKMNQLQSIVIEGEESVAKIQQSIADYSRMDHSQLKGTRSPGLSSRSRRDARTADKLMRADKDSALAKIVASVKEMKFRYDSKEQRKEKLEAMGDELIKNKDAMIERKATLEQQLAKAIDRFNQLASNRQIYKEMEKQEVAIHNARKECDEWNEREHKLNLSIDMLKSALPRLLTKVTRIQHPTPALEQLPDALHKLEDEVNLMMKNTSSMLLKEATAEDIAAANAATLQSGYTENSEIEKIERMPGFERLSKQIYYNLMTAHDASRDPNNYNIRVTSVLNRDNSEGQFGSPTMGSPVTKGGKVRMFLGSGEDEMGSTASSPDVEGRPEPEDIVSLLTGPVDGSEYVDRAKLKQISALIIDRDAAKFGYTHLKSTKIEKEKKAYKPKFIAIP